jgi:hypothetical protein
MVSVFCGQRLVFWVSVTMSVSFLAFGYPEYVIIVLSNFLTSLGSGNDESLPTFDGISALVLICLNSSDTATWVSHVVK